MSVESPAIPLRVLRSSSALQSKRQPTPPSEDGGVQAIPHDAVSSAASTLPESPVPVLERSDSQGAQSSQSSSETTFSLDRAHLESLFKAVWPQVQEPLTHQLSAVSVDVSVSKLLQAIVSLIVLAKVLMEAFGALK